MFTMKMELSLQSSISNSDFERLGGLMVGFFNHFEKEYFICRPERVGICKLALHTLIHFQETVLRCGPLVNCSQIWCERFI